MLSMYVCFAHLCRIGLDINLIFNVAKDALILKQLWQ